jgi:hypothetical protein
MIAMFLLQRNCGYEADDWKVARTEKLLEARFQPWRKGKC